MRLTFNNIGFISIDEEPKGKIMAKIAKSIHLEAVEIAQIDAMADKIGHGATFSSMARQLIIEGIAARSMPEKVKAAPD